MSEDHFTWSDAFNWIFDKLVFAKHPSLQSKLPKLESKDGQECTTESLREEARQIDARNLPEQTEKLSAQDRKSLENEFWNTF